MPKKEEKTLAESVIILTKLIKQLRSERYLQMIENRKKFLFYNFLAGIARGLGFALGTTVILGLIIWLLSQLITIPVLGAWISQIIEYTR